ncbi:protein of unknown function [Jannaschia faecimaris]|uniref:DUF4178 domain-containing protein n=1 Tax=Jannaschia faecimaris TaxID=1244108 RepID=A0A1H3Q963_9RHOB|nr:DUF4178 domain-containing protein [Jannaschia faecimaris]SDZ09946.1 protein of unknown function [Jannaschia faecimaris]
MTEQIRSINCTNCGAGLPVLGGGRVTTQVCGYCGASLDANDAYRVLEIWDGMERPRSPFRLGMQGQIDGVTFTIIGTLGMQEEYRGVHWDWVDHQLFSPTHGYAWLTIEDGHCVLTRKLRDGPMQFFLTSAEVERAEHPPRVLWKGTKYRYYATTNWETTYVEGEFNWRPERGRGGTTVTVMSNDPKDGMLAFVEPSGGGEREIERSHLWPEAQEAFGVENPIRAHGQHPLQDIKPTFGRIMIAWFAGLSAISLVLAFVVLGMQPAPQMMFQGTIQDIPPELTFRVNDTKRPARLELYQELNNAFAGYEVTMQAPDGTPLAETYREISYYSGGSGDDAWSEGSRSQSLNFVPPMPGDYRVTVTPDAAGTTSGRFRVTFREGRLNSFWLWATTVLFAGGAIAIPFLGLAKRSARWKGSDWSSED